MKNYYFRFCANVCRAVIDAGSEIATILNEFNQSFERKKNLICPRLFTASKNICHREILCLKVRKNGQPKAGNLFCNIASKQVEKPYCAFSHSH